MTVNYTTNLSLGQPVTGTESGTWGDDVNNSVTSYLDIAIAGGLAITITTTDVTLSITQGTSSATNIGSTTAQYAILNVSGAMTAARNLIVPSSSRIYLINNNTTGGFALTVKGSATSGVTMVNGEKAHVFWNGSDYAKLSNTPGGAGTFSSITNTGLTSGRVVYSTTGGLETDSANLLYSGTDLTVYGITVGRGAGAVSTNTAVGASALAVNTTGASNTATGTQALASNTTFSSQTAVGYQALYTNNSGNVATAVGYKAGYALNATGAYGEVFVGYNAGVATTSGNYITVVGGSALAANTTGSSITAVGAAALLVSTTGAQNTAIGTRALTANTTGSNHTAVGHLALGANTTGEYNTAVGSQALNSNTTASYNTAVGYQAVNANTTGAAITAIGNQALYANTTGNNNTAVGAARPGFFGGTMSVNTTGSDNVAVGGGALYSNTTANDNVAMGALAMYTNTTGASNVAMGSAALRQITTGSNNTCMGYQSGYAITTGGANVVIGQYTGNNLTTGSNNVFIGVGVTASGVSTGQEVAIGYGATGKGANTGIISPNGGGVYQGNNLTTWAVTSDQRLKKNIVDNNTGLDVINQIQVRNFEYRLPEEITDVPQDQAIKKSGVQLGVIAQELQQILPDCIKTESTGVMTVNSDNLIWYLINAVKELTARVAQLEAKGA